MWPFTKREVPVQSWLTPEQARRVTKIFFADHDANCWYACARVPDGESVRIATSSKEEAVALAHSLAGEVLAKSGRVLTVDEGP